MATNYPTSLDSFTTINPTDTQNSPSHSARHNNTSDSVVALETKVGVDNSAVTTSIDYLLRNTTLLTGSGVPAGGTGSNGNMYLDTATGIIYRKSAGTWSAIYTPAGGGVAAGSGQLFLNGVAPVQRNGVTTTSAITAGTLRLAGFISPKSFTAANMSAYVSSGAGGAGLLKYGLYSLNSSGDGTLVASTSNQSASSGSSGKVTFALSSSVAVTAGTAYAVAVLCTTTSPTYYISNTGSTQLSSGQQPFYAASLAGQTDLPASFTFASLTVQASAYYLELTT